MPSGRRITDSGGSDAHHGVPESPDQATPNSKQPTANYEGTPTTWVFATWYTLIQEPLVNSLARIAQWKDEDKSLEVFYR